MYYYEEYPVKEIAAILGLKEAAVRKRLSRARAALKQKLQEEWNEDE
ncbi:RNA polymerase sigma factor [uncultured Dubosiella sp.]